MRGVGILRLWGVMDLGEDPRARSGKHSDNDGPSWSRKQYVPIPSATSALSCKMYSKGRHGETSGSALSSPETSKKSRHSCLSQHLFKCHPGIHLFAFMPVSHLILKEVQCIFLTAGALAFEEAMTN